MKRRQFLQFGAAGLGAAICPLGVSSGNGLSWQQSFNQSLGTRSDLLGFRGIQEEELKDDDVHVEGKIPGELNGVLYRNGPARHEIGDFRYRHWFDGDGMIQSFRLQNGKVDHHGRMIQTRKYQEEKAAGRALYPGFGSHPQHAQNVTSADELSTANISVLVHHGELLALWEAGSAHVIDERSLETKGLKHWSGESRGLPFSAHPRVEPDGTLWNFGYASSFGALILWHISANGRLLRNGVIPLEHMGMPHDFIVTSKHIVIMLPPFHFEPESGDNFLDAHHWKPERPTQLLIVDKNNFENYQYAELPAQWVFHFGNGWEDRDGMIHFDVPRATDPGTMTHFFRNIMEGRMDISPTDSIHHGYRINTKTGKVEEEALVADTLITGFPVIDHRISTRQYRQVICLGSKRTSTSASVLFDSVVKLNVESGNYDIYTYPDHLIPEEHLFVPAPGSNPEAEGWIIGTSLDYVAKQTKLSVFHANALMNGPIAVATLPYAIPFGLHGKFHQHCV